MKMLVRIGDIWIDRSMINGVVREGNAYRITVGEHGLQIPYDLTANQARTILLEADIVGF